MHTHNTASVSSKWVVQNITYREGILLCTASYDTSIKIFTFKETTEDCLNDIRFVSELRAESSNITEFDEKLEGLINLWTPTPNGKYNQINQVFLI